MLLTNIQPCELLSWCLYSGGDEYLESEKYLSILAYHRSKNYFLFCHSN